jgi:hypothetical protein
MTPKSARMRTSASRDAPLADLSFGRLAASKYPSRTGRPYGWEKSARDDWTAKEDNERWAHQASPLIVMLVGFERKILI